MFYTTSERVFPQRDLSWEDRYGVVEQEYAPMTVCIAAICDNGNAIVTCADRQVGLGFTSTDFKDGKFRHLYGKWIAGIAGTVTNAAEVIGEAMLHEQALASYAVHDVVPAVERAYRSVRLRKAEAQHLANRGWTLDEFKNEGAAKLPSSTYAGIDARIAQFDLGASLLIAGFSEKIPIIATVRDPGTAVDHTILSFWCIGSGSTAAQMSLFARNYVQSMSCEEAAYYVYEAKRLAEAATGVGPETDLYVLRRGKDNIIPIRLYDDAENALDGIWNGLKPKQFKDADKAKLAVLDSFKAAAKAGVP